MHAKLMPIGNNAYCVFGLDSHSGLHLSSNCGDLLSAALTHFVYVQGLPFGEGNQPT
jgi:hypothetical protein